ncbi:MAG: CbiX/SirB N-terminal domain-containing protein [Candidatus Nealsonbacteria bacterium]|nr:CbiX/SirB N-terminal domain-containing protein [Candidatus Nealsonbacteria bacterium]
MLVLIAHGSNNPQWRASIERLIESLQAEFGEDEVRLAYLAFAPPTLTDVATDAARLEAGELRILPLFLTAQGHVDRDLRPLIEQLRKTHEAVKVELLPPIGQHPLFRELLGKIVETRGRM